MRAGCVYDGRFLEHAAAGHPERPDRLLAVRRGIEAAGLWDELIAVDARPIDEALLERVHDKQQLALVDSAGAGGLTSWLDPDTYVTSGSPAIARLAAGGTVGLAQEIVAGGLDRGLALVRPPGHHATSRRSMGFCLYNNAALAAVAALEAGVERVAIVDYDVHHGNGTQDIFWNEPRVLYVSTHQFPFYPGTGAWNEVGGPDAAGTTINVPLAAGSGDTALRTVMDDVVALALARFRPGLLIVSLGFDAYWKDPLAELMALPETYRHLVATSVEAAGPSSAGRTLVVLEGGYDLPGLAVCAAAATAALLGRPVSLPDQPRPVLPEEPNIGKLVSQLRSLHQL